MEKEEIVKSIMNEYKGIYTPSKYSTQKVYYEIEVRCMIRKAFEMGKLIREKNGR